MNVRVIQRRLTALVTPPMLCLFSNVGQTIAVIESVALLSLLGLDPPPIKPQMDCTATISPLLIP